MEIQNNYKQTVVKVDCVKHSGDDCLANLQHIENIAKKNKVHEIIIKIKGNVRQSFIDFLGKIENIQIISI